MSKNHNLQYPQIILDILRRLENFVQRHCQYGRPGISRAMRTERSRSLVVLLGVLAKSACFSQDGCFVKVIDGTAFPLTVGNMARMAKLSRSNVERCLKDLRDLQFIESTSQKKRKGEDGSLQAGPVLRRFSKKFWLAIGLFSQFVAAVRYACEHAKLRIAWVFKSVKRLKDLVSKARARSKAAVPKVTETEEAKERRRRNAAFTEFLKCRDRHSQGCIGGYASAQACAFCRQFRND